MPSDVAAGGALAVGSAVRYLHSIEVAHRDIKPANVLLDLSRGWCLCDFGFAVQCDERPLKRVVGTPLYLAPELVAGSSYSGKAADMWAFGAMVYEMLHSRPPFVAVAAAQNSNGVGRAARVVGSYVASAANRLRACSRTVGPGVAGEQRGPQAADP